MTAVRLAMPASLLAEAVELGRGLGLQLDSVDVTQDGVGHLVLSGPADQLDRLLDQFVPARAAWTITGPRRCELAVRLVEAARRAGGVVRGRDEGGVTRLQVWGAAAVRAVTDLARGRGEIVHTARGAVAEA